MWRFRTPQIRDYDVLDLAEVFSGKKSTTSTSYNLLDCLNSYTLAGYRQRAKEVFAHDHGKIAKIPLPSGLSLNQNAVLSVVTLACPRLQFKRYPRQSLEKRVPNRRERREPRRRRRRDYDDHTPSEVSTTCNVAKKVGGVVLNRFGAIASEDSDNSSAEEDLCRSVRNEQTFLRPEKHVEPAFSDASVGKDDDASVGQEKSLLESADVSETLSEDPQEEVDLNELSKTEENKAFCELNIEFPNAPDVIPHRWQEAVDLTIYYTLGMANDDLDHVKRFIRGEEGVSREYWRARGLLEPFPALDHFFKSLYGVDYSSERHGGYYADFSEALEGHGTKITDPLDDRRLLTLTADSRKRVEEKEARQLPGHKSLNFFLGPYESGFIVNHETSGWKFLCGDKSGVLTADHYSTSAVHPGCISFREDRDAEMQAAAAWIIKENILLRLDTEQMKDEDTLEEELLLSSADDGFSDDRALGLIVDKTEDHSPERRRKLKQKPDERRNETKVAEKRRAKALGKVDAKRVAIYKAFVSLLNAESLQDDQPTAAPLLDAAGNTLLHYIAQTGNAPLLRFILRECGFLGLSFSPHVLDQVTKTTKIDAAIANRHKILPFLNAFHQRFTFPSERNDMVGLTEILATALGNRAFLECGAGYSGGRMAVWNSRGRKFTRFSKKPKVKKSSTTTADSSLEKVVNASVLTGVSEKKSVSKETSAAQQVKKSLPATFSFSFTFDLVDDPVLAPIPPPSQTHNAFHAEHIANANCADTQWSNGSGILLQHDGPSAAAFCQDYCALFQQYVSFNPNSYYCGVTGLSFVNFYVDHFLQTQKVITELLFPSTNTRSSSEKLPVHFETGILEHCYNLLKHVLLRGDNLVKCNLNSSNRVSSPTSTALSAVVTDIAKGRHFLGTLTQLEADKAKRQMWDLYAGKRLWDVACSSDGVWLSSMGDCFPRFFRRSHVICQRASSALLRCRVNALEYRKNHCAPSSVVLHAPNCVFAAQELQANSSDVVLESSEILSNATSLKAVAAQKQIEQKMQTASISRLGVHLGDHLGVHRCSQARVEFLKRNSLRDFFKADVEFPKPHCKRTHLGVVVDATNRDAIIDEKTDQAVEHNRPRFRRSESLALHFLRMLLFSHGRDDLDVSRRVGVGNGGRETILEWIQVEINRIPRENNGLKMAMLDIIRECMRVLGRTNKEAVATKRSERDLRGR